MITIETLGPVRVTVNDHAAPPELLWRKHLALLVYLARSPKRRRTRAHLISMLWPDKDEGAARHSLNEALRVIRKAAPNGIESDAEQVAIHPDAVQLDVDALDQLIDAADWAAAAGLVFGPFLEGFELAGALDFETWLATERLTWQRRSVEALLRLSEDQLARGELTTGLATAERAVKLDPWSEPGLGRVIRALALLGLRSEALSRYDAFAESLAAELGAAVGGELTALAERIRAQTTRARPRDQRAQHQLRRPPLVGRAAELTRLIDSWHRTVATSQPELSLITGPSGAGRSRLLEEVASRLALDGAVTLRVRAVPADQDEPWSGIVTLAGAGLASAPGVAGTPPPAVTALSLAVPEWAERFGATGPPGTDWSLGRAFGEAVAMVALERPVGLLIDDAQWLDDESLGAIEGLARRTAGRPIWIAMTVVGEARRPVIDRLASQLGRDLAGTAVAVEPFGGKPIVELVRWVFPHYGADEVERLARRVGTDSAGMPLLAVELLHALASGMEPGAAAWPAPLQTLDQSLPADLPPELVAAFRVSFRRLTDPAQAVLAALSVLGDRASDTKIAAVAELDLEATRAALDELEWARWVESEPRGYGFVARIAKGVVRQDMLTPGQRRRLEAQARGA